MIRTYTVKELEDLSGLTRRTIGDYVSKGLLAGPSHRGRGACYAQADVDVLRVIPRLRVLMKKDFSTLRALQNFLAQLSSRDLHSLARKTNAEAFVLAVRELRLRLLLSAMLPQVPVARIEKTVAALSPEQIRSIDTGRSQLGSVIDMSDLLQGDADDSGVNSEHGDVSVAANASAHRHGNGHRPGNSGSASISSESPVRAANDAGSDSSWSVSWLQGQSSADDDESLKAGIANDGSGEFQNLFGGAPRAYAAATDDFVSTKRESSLDRLTDISRRLERLERLLATE